MSKFLKMLTCTLALLATTSSPLLAEKLGIGRLALPDEIAAWDIDIRPDGVGLTRGAGTVRQGDNLYIERCASCHGDFGEGVGRWPLVAGGAGTLTDERAVKTVGSYWPYLSTLFDYVRRTMPFGESGTLSDDDVYALLAYLLFANDVVEDEDFELSDRNFLSIRLTNEDGFISDNRGQVEYPVFTDACMSLCKDLVTITKHIPDPGLTPN